MSSKKFTVEILEPAQKELENIALLHLSLVDPASAKKITDKIYKSLERLESQPFSGPLVNDPVLASEGYRFVVTDNYLSIYRVFDQHVVIYHIFDGKTDYPNLFYINP